MNKIIIPYFILIAQRATAAPTYSAQPSDGKINVQYRMPTNKFTAAVDPMLDITTGSTTSTANGKTVSDGIDFSEAS